MCVAGESKWLLGSCELLQNSAGGDNDVCGEAIGRDMADYGALGACGGARWCMHQHASILVYFCYYFVSILGGVGRLAAPHSQESDAPGHSPDRQRP